MSKYDKDLQKIKEENEVTDRNFKYFLAVLAVIIVFAIGWIILNWGQLKQLIIKDVEQFKIEYYEEKNR